MPSTTTETTEIDYLAVGHVTDDLWADGRVTAGGTVMYASRCARTLVDRVAVLTAATASFHAADVFPDIEVHRLETAQTTQFWNVYDGSHRTQFTRVGSVRLHGADLAPALRRSRIVHLAPVCDEVDVDVLDERTDVADADIIAQESTLLAGAASSVRIKTARLECLGNHMRQINKLSRILFSVRTRSYWP